MALSWDYHQCREYYDSEAGPETRAADGPRAARPRRQRRRPAGRPLRPPVTVPVHGDRDDPSNLTRVVTVVFWAIPAANPSAMPPGPEPC